MDTGKQTDERLVFPVYAAISGRQRRCNADSVLEVQKEYFDSDGQLGFKLNSEPLFYADLSVLDWSSYEAELLTVNDKGISFNVTISAEVCFHNEIHSCKALTQTYTAVYEDGVLKLANMYLCDMRANAVDNVKTVFDFAEPSLDAGDASPSPSENDAMTVDTDNVLLYVCIAEGAVTIAALAAVVIILIKKKKS